MAATNQMLTEAEAAMHRLQTGTAVVEVRDSNGETVRYNQASLSKLAAYIQSLKSELGLLADGVGPMRVWF